MRQQLEQLIKEWGIRQSRTGSTSEAWAINQCIEDLRKVLLSLPPEEEPS